MDTSWAKEPPKQPLSPRDTNVLTQTVTVSYADVTPTIVDVLARGGMVTVEMRRQARFYLVRVPCSKTTTVKLSRGDSQVFCAGSKIACCEKT